MVCATSRLVSPCETSLATCTSRGVKRLHGCILRFLLNAHRNRQLDALAAILDAGAQKQRTQMLFDGAWADPQLAGDFFVGATLYQQLQYLLVPLRDLHLIQINHGPLPSALPFADAGQRKKSK